MKIALLTTCCALAVLSSACGSSAKQATCDGLPPPVTKATGDYRLAYADAGTEGASAFRMRQAFSMNDAAARAGLNLTVFSANNQADIQSSQLASIVAGGYDALFLSPVDTSSAVPQVLAARKACIPVFLVDSDLDQSRGAQRGIDYVTFVGQDPVQQGNVLANWLLTNVPGALTVLELTGVDNTYVTKGREQGFDSVVATQPRVSIVSRVAANLRRSQARTAVQDAFSTNQTFNVVFAHNDAMGLGAVDALKDPRNAGLLGSRTLGKDIVFLSVDGTLDVVNQIQGTTYNATVDSFPDMGSTVLQAWSDYMSGAIVDSVTPLPMTLIDGTNAANAAATAY